MKKLLMIILFIFLVTGCNYIEDLNNLGIINGIGIEIENNNYKLYASIIEEINDNKIKTKIYEATANSLNQAIENLNFSLNKKIYLSHLDLLLINSTIKTKEIEEIINFFLKRSNTREDFLVLYTDNIKSIFEKEDIKNINNLIKINQIENNKSINTTMYDVIKNFYERKTIYFSNIKIIDENIKLDGAKSFQNNKYETFNQEEVIFLNYLSNNLKNFTYTYKCNYGLTNLKIRSLKSEIKNKLIINNEITVLDNNCNLSKNNIKNEFNNYLKNNLQKFTKYKINIQSTIRGFYENN